MSYHRVMNVGISCSSCHMAIPDVIVHAPFCPWCRHEEVGRRLVVDPQTLAIRFDLGELSIEPDDDVKQQMCTNGHVLVFVTSPHGDDGACQIVAVDAAGRVGWRLNVGAWIAHYFLGGNLVVVSGGELRVVRPEDGKVLAEHEDA